MDFATLIGRKNPRAFVLDKAKLTQIAAKGQGRLMFDEPLARYTTLRVGGKADAIYFPTSLEDLRRVLAFAEESKIPVFLLGGGANLLIRDGGIRGLVVSLREGLQNFDEVTAPKDAPQDKVYWRVEGGLSTARLVRAAAQRGLSGLEGLAGVVGTVGGACIMNAGTRNGVIGDAIVSLTCINRAGQVKTFARQDLKFSYRHVDLDKSWYVIEALLALAPASPEVVQAKVKEYLDYRQRTQPLSYPNAGSIFKNPKQGSAGEILERCGLKGVRLRGAQISELHANWIINLGNATAEDIVGLIDLAREKVKEKEDIDLEAEIRIVGEK